jgi:hypothetical protein
MFSGVRRLVGAIKVIEDRDQIRIEGLPADLVEKDILKIWSTSKITGFMFTELKKSSLKFNKFFAPDFAYTLQRILSERENKKRFEGYNYRALRQLVELLYEHTWLKRTVSPSNDILDFTQINRLKKTPLDSQMKFLHAYNDIVPKFGLNGFMLAAEPGTGKTIAGLLLGACLNTDVNIFIVPKNSVDRVWRATLENELKKSETCWFSDSNVDLTPGYKNYVFHYEQLERAVLFFTGKVFRMPMIWLDESHNLNEMDTARSKLVVDLVKAISCKHTVWASGTPFKAVGKEVIPLLVTIDPFFDEDAKYRFLQIFGKNSNRGLDILAARLGNNMIKVDKSEISSVLLPPVEVKVEMPNGHDYTLEVVRGKMRDFIMSRMAYYEEEMPRYLDLYNECLRIYAASIRKSESADFEKYKRFVYMIRKGYDPKLHKEEVKYCNLYELKKIVPTLPQALREEFKDARSVVKYYFLKVQGEALGRVLGRLREQCHVDMVEYSKAESFIDAATKKTIIFSTYVGVVKKMGDYLTEKGYKPILIYGETNKDLSTLLKQFEEDVDLNPVIATYKSLSTAVPMIMANNILMFNAPYRDYERQQAIARCWRQGQDSSVSIFDYALDTGKETNLSTRNIDIMTWSRDTVAALMGKPVVDDLEIGMECFTDVSLEAADLSALLMRRSWF